MYLRIMKLYPVTSRSAFNFNENDNITESAMMDDIRLSDDIDSTGWYERFSDSTQGI